jgi:hypothetical protein
LHPESDTAIEVLKRMDEIRQDDRIFSISEHAMWLCLKDLRPDVTVHGFR